MKSISFAILFSLSAQAALPPPAAAMPQVTACFTSADVFAVGDACTRIWSDSLRSSAPETVRRARSGLIQMGGRTAVDALRSDYERLPTREARLAAITAMASTGSPEDIAFLSTQLAGAFTNNSDTWPTIQLAATTLGLLRATNARDSLQSALSRNGGASGTLAGGAVAYALASLDRPPCADTVSGDLSIGLVRIVMQCGPQAMSTTVPYAHEGGQKVWYFANNIWQVRDAVAGDSAITRTVGTRTTIASDGRHADVMVSTSCGRLCGEGWFFRLMLVGRAWRVVSASMAWVS